ncbi:MAG: DUF2764 family protein [Bacteroidales bacterium]|nr:DUF2764 family protein [Bacteroidales bacterium]
MNNYEYIIACLPVPEAAGILDADGLIRDIRSQCSPADNSLISLLADSFDSSNLTAELYNTALASRNAFIREYFLWDLRVRNTKTEFLNARLGRPGDADVIDLPGALEFDEKPQVQNLLAGSDILERERGLDDLMWKKADELTRLHVFDMDVILAFIAKIKITDRWNRLDPQTGRAMFRTLVEEIRQTRD